MLTKFTIATLITSLLLTACNEPVATDDPIETLSMDDRIALETDPATAPESVSVIALTPLNLTGTYAMSGVACDFIAGTLTISETSIRLTETICAIAQSQPLDAMTMSYTLSGCRSDAGEEPDRDITVIRNEDGNIRVTKWDDQTFEYNLCPS